MRVGRILLFLALLVLGLVGLGMTVCGGTYTVAVLMAGWRMGRGDPYSSAVLVFSLPALLLGGFVTLLAWERIVKLWTHKD